MEPVHGKRKESKFAPQDFISNMPDNVVTNILDRLPIQDAVRTGILAKNWRFKWNMVSQLVLDVCFRDYLSKTKGKINKYWSIISSLLFQLNGTITKFVLRGKLDDGNISLWILFLSTRGIKYLSLVHDGIPPFKLPTHIFSCLELEHLKLANCCFNPPPTFRGFPNLLSFEFTGETREPGEFIIRCPLLEKLKLSYSDKVGKVKLVEIAKLKNLELLYLQLCDLYTTTTVSSYNIIELLGSLPKLQDLRLDFTDYKDADLIPIPEVEYNTTTLRNVFFTCFAGSENDMCLIKYLLACSPFLERFYIFPYHRLAPAEQLKLTTKLLKLPRASAVAEIYFEHLLF